MQRLARSIPVVPQQVEALAWAGKGALERGPKLLGFTCANHLAWIENACPFNHVAQLTNIARPIMFHETRQGRWIEARSAREGRIRLEMVDEERNIFCTACKARDLDRNDAKPEIKASRKRPSSIAPTNSDGSQR